MGAAALGPDEARGVAVVHHHQRIVGIRQTANVHEIGEIAIHGEDAIGDDDDAPGTCPARGFQLGLEIIHVAIGESVALGLRQPDAIDDRGVVQRIRDDGVLLAEQRLEDGAVGVEAGGEEDGIIGAEVVRDATLKCEVQVGRAADEAHRRHAEAMGVQRLLRRGDECRMVGQAQIVVGAEVQDLAAACDRDVRGLVTEDRAFGFP